MTELVERTPEELQKAIDEFSCQRNSEVIYFLRERAVLFESLAKSRTYFLLDAAAFAEKRLEVLAYFTLSPHLMRLPSEMSVRQIQKLDGFSGKLRGEKIKVLPVYLIGQLARNDKYQDAISGGAILSYALSIIQRAHNIIGGRIVMVDVNSAADGLIRFYQKYGFKVIDTDKAVGLTQLVIMLKR